MKTVRKYAIPGDGKSDFALALPVDAQVVDVRSLDGSPYLFALVEPGGPNDCTESRRFILTTENSPVDDRAKDHEYIGTFIQRVVTMTPPGQQTAPRETPYFVFEVVLPLVATAKRAETATTPRDLSNEAALFDTIDGLMAYDQGAVDSGIRDEALRKQVIDHLKAVAAHGRTEHQRYSLDFTRLMYRFIQHFFLSDRAIQQTYGYEDLSAFVRWLDELMA